MDNALYVGLSRQMTLRRELDIVANNIANADTTGFKVESLMVETAPRAPAMTQGGSNPIKFVLDSGVARDFSPGALRKTDAPFDLGAHQQLLNLEAGGVRIGDVVGHDVELAAQRHLA